MISPTVVLAGVFAIFIFTQAFVDSVIPMTCHVLPNYSTTDHIEVGETGVMYSNAPSDYGKHYLQLKRDSVAGAAFAIRGPCPMALRNISFYAFRGSICSASYHVQVGATSFNVTKNYNSNCSRTPCLHSYLFNDFPEKFSDQRYGPSTLSVTIRGGVYVPCAPLLSREQGSRPVLRLWMQFVNNTMTVVSKFPNSVQNRTVTGKTTSSKDSTTSLYLIIGASVGGGAVFALTLSCIIVYVKRRTREIEESKRSSDLPFQESPRGHTSTNTNREHGRSSVVYDLPTTSPSLLLKQTINPKSCSDKSAVHMYESIADGVQTCQPMTMTLNCAYRTVVEDANV